MFPLSFMEISQAMSTEGHVIMVIGTPSRFYSRIELAFRLSDLTGCFKQIT